MAEIFLTSDTHFYHPLMAKLRGFDSVEEHDEAIIDIWNKTVNPGDHVYHQGDFALCPGSKIADYTRKLNGNIYLVRGNHDSFGLSASKSRGFSWIKDYHEMQIDDQRFVLFHYPLLSWHWARTGTMMIHGHCHLALQDSEQSRGRTKDVCMTLDKGLYHIDDLIAELKARPLIYEGDKNE